MNEKNRDKKLSVSINTILTSGLIGFLGAAVLYRKNFPTWMPIVFNEYPWVFFAMFIVICGILGYIWSIVDDD